MPPFPEITKADLNNPGIFEHHAISLYRAGFFKDTPSALNFLTQVRQRAAVQRPWESPTVQVLTDDLKFDLREKWEALNLPAFDSVTGVATSTASNAPAKKGESLQLYRVALSRVEKGEFATFEEALDALSSESHTPLPRVVRAIAELMSSEPAMLKAEKEALDSLQQIRANLAATRSAAVSVLTTRDQKEAIATDLAVELNELQSKQTLITARRSRAFTDVRRHLAKGAAIPWQMLTDSAAIVAGFDIVLGELSRQTADKQQAVALAKQAYEEFIGENASALSLAERPRV
jgi:hypothetical protein